ncbi:phosphoenolpyruvate synthase [Clostridium lacusfryxellense]|uniref:phosphoenolpyruvate synthase n=1 Tax=Clostridium lacusfryxellense TaxID=205328 RepID=UPI001C0BA0AE|nr:phosphoenolpyruvate synthase [Clostridium lacusfryxellense]MBU3113393.1 phosphoenolpyruvate synthase [Clostridium lacusfryxellense]
MKKFIVDIENFENCKVGVKAHNLFLMRKNKINTPDLFCIDSTFLAYYLKDYSVQIEDTIKNINYNDEKSLENASLYFKSIVSDIRFDDEFKEAVVNYLEKKFGKSDSFSVRSSSTVEDGDSSSFAGQFDTYLNVSKEDIFDKIKDCLGSLFSANVLKYCLDKKIKIIDLKMSVILQKMINADASGVIFTANPRGLLNEMVIVVGAGTGDLVVEDKVPTTTYYYNTFDEDYYLEKQEHSIVLDTNTFQRIIETIIMVKNVYGEYLDIEFALFKGVIYILQVRPITTLKRDKTIIFDNSNIVESYPNITLPLSASFVKEAYYGVFYGLSKRILSNEMIIKKYHNVLKEMVDSVNGRMYYNINNWYTLIKFLPLSKKIIPIWQEMLGVASKEYNSEKVDISISQRTRTYLSFVKQFLFVPKEMDKLNNKYIEVSDHFKIKYKNNLDNKLLVELYNSISERVLKDWDITLLNDLYAFIYVGLIKYRFKKMKTENYEADTNKFISGISNIESMKPIKMLVELAKIVLKENLLEDLVGLKDNKMLANYLDGNNSNFAQRFKQYIDIYGDRSFEELKLESSTFRVSQITLVEKILEYTEDKEKLLNISKFLENEDNKKISDELLEKCGQVERKIIRFFSSRAMLGIKNREISRLNRSRIYGMVRTIFLTIGQNFCNSKSIEIREDIFYLKTTEVFDFIAGQDIDLKELINIRKQEYKMFSKLPNSSRLIFSNKVFEKKHSNINSEEMFENRNEIFGIPCSNGLVIGEVVVVDDPKKIKEFKNKILVTKMTDPGWVFLITLSKGIIAEKGSLLSHTAIISRELNIPSIVGVKNITNILRTGDIIKMNGNTGEIEIEKRMKQKWE